MDESKRKRLEREEMLRSCASVQTAGGHVQVRWASESAATPMGPLAYFIEFLTLTGLWSRWLEGCPLAYVSPDARARPWCWAPRRVVVLRRPLQGEVLIAQENEGQGLLGFIEADRKTGKRTTGDEYALRLSNLDDEIVSL
ncbi:MAG: hypothetical protein ABIP64_13810, partial [Burkholderiales bacterium]